MIHIIRTTATHSQITEMLLELDPIIKLAVDIRRNILAGGGQMHADCEAILIEDGSRQEDIWGANWLPSTKAVEFEALINNRPSKCYAFPENYFIQFDNFYRNASHLFL